MPISTFLNDNTPVRLRGLLWLALSDTGHAGTLASTDDSGGGASQAWTFGTAIPCRIDPLGASGRDFLAGRVDERSTHLVTVPPGTSVELSGRFSIDSRGTFEVTALRSQTGELASSFEVIQVA